MKAGTKKKLLPLCFALIALGLLAYTFFGENLFSQKATEESYSFFYEQVEKGNVKEVKVRENRLEYLKEGSEELFYTQNPESPLLKEFLLKNNVSVSVEKNGAEIFSLVFDILFYVIFFGIIFVVFRKFISPNTFKVVHKTGKTFNDVVGMDNLKRDMAQIIQIMQHPAEYAKKGIRMPKGILLEGAPGNGKTLFAKALAGESGRGRRNLS